VRSASAVCAYGVHSLDSSSRDASLSADVARRSQ